MIYVTLAQYKSHKSNHDGICLECGKWKFSGVEPDAENYPCSACGKEAVCGVELAMIIGDIEVLSSQ